METCLVIIIPDLIVHHLRFNSSYTATPL